MRQERINQGLSIDKLASLCQMSSSQISVIERGQNPLTGKYNNITLTSLELIGKGLGLSVYEILENSGYYDKTIPYSKHKTIQKQTFLDTQYQKLSVGEKEKVLLYIEDLLSMQKSKI